MNEIDKDKFRVSRRNTCTWLAPKGVTFWHTDKFVDGNGPYWIISDCPKSLEDDIRETEGIWICAARGDDLMVRMTHENENTYEVRCKSGKLVL